MSNKLPYKPQFELIDKNDRLKEVVSILSKCKVIGIDTETTGLDPHLAKVLLVQIADQEKCYIFDCEKVDICLLKELLEDTDILKLLQNAKFDYKMLKASYDIKIKNIFCTMSAERLINAGISGFKSSLKVLADKYLGIALDKEIRKQFVETAGYQRAGFSDEELEYAANDALILFPIYEQQVTELIDRELVEVALLEFSVIEVTAEMELIGVLINTDRWKEIVEQVNERREETQHLIFREFSSVVQQNNLFGAPVININSSKQLLSYLSKLGVKTKSGEPLPSTDESVLSEIKDKYHIIKLLLDYKGDEKVVTTYGKALLKKINQKTGRLHATFDQLRAATGRYSSSSPNLQNIPAYRGKKDFVISDRVTIKEEFLLDLGTSSCGPYMVERVVKDNKKGDGIAFLSGINKDVSMKNLIEYPMIDFRSCFVAKRGRKLITADYSQQELRILADASGDPVFARAYQNNEDIHTRTAADIFNVPLEKVTKAQRTQAKQINFALVYGAGPWKISKSLNITEQEAARLIEKYFETYPKIKNFLQGIADFAVRNRYSYTITGRKRYFSIPDGSHPEYKKIIGSVRRQAANTYIQGSAADVTKLAMKLTYDELNKKGLDANLVLIVHDEIVLDVEESIAKEVAELLEKCMVLGFSSYFKTIPMMVDAVIKNFWSKD